MDKRKIQDFTADYINSFDVLLQKLPLIAKNIRGCDVELEGNERHTVTIEQISIRSPKWSDDNNKPLYPWECRRSHLNYEGNVVLTIGVSVNGVHKCAVPIPIGSVPIMVKSKLCNLVNLKPEELIQHNEEDDELGGYFIVGGNQVMIRYLVQNRRNFPILNYRESADNKGNRTGHQISINCARNDETIAAMAMVWNSNTAPEIKFQIHSKIYFIPLPYILKALMDKSTKDMMNDIPKSKSNTSLIANLSMMFDKFNSSNEHFTTQTAALEYLGNFFRGVMRCSKWISNVEAGRILLKDYIAIHLTTDKDKYNLLLAMLIKLQNFVINRCCPESLDTLNFQDILTPGVIYLLVLKKALESGLAAAVRNLPRIMGSRKINKVEDGIRTAFRDSIKILNDMNYFMSTGNIRNGIISGIKQSTGLRIMVDNINFYRFVANFRAFHRGAFFTTTKNSAIRRLLPESWGFVCPVHTPDGTPCGLLNHFAIDTMVQTATPTDEEMKNLDGYLHQYTWSMEKLRHQQNQDDCICVMCDGRLVGYVLESNAKNFAIFLRKLKVVPNEKPIPSVTEIVFINRTQTASQFPGLYLFTTAGRLLRPVYNLMFGSPIVEYIGTFEQTYLDIAGQTADGPNLQPHSTHAELSVSSLYSFIASFTPYQNHNPSPRNMYQCQMSKQSMGYQYYTLRYRGDNKLYCFLAPQLPLTRAKVYDEYGMAKRPLGYNAVVAVCSYTGFDMEDAMVINRASIDRGMGRCCIYKHKQIDLNEDRARDPRILDGGDKPPNGLDTDGLPFIGQRMEPGKSPLYAHLCPQTLVRGTETYKGDEVGYVVSVSLNGSRSRATICLKMLRNTSIGDKFASRHGQKGVNSLQIPMVDLPFNEDGVVPDQLFNPHSFPTRMTMGKLIEFVSGKLAAMSGEVMDCTAFQDRGMLARYMAGLRARHYDGSGCERLYNGYHGRLIDSDVNMGVIYYQRLRHLVDDKFQVRAEGKIDIVTRQPVKGRQRGGGIRLGEMERDGLLSHGAVYCLQERMVDSSSDRLRINYCVNCKSFVHAYFKPPQKGASWNTNSEFAKKNTWQCRMCEGDTLTSTELMKADVPAVTRHLFHELATMNIRVNLSAVPIDDNEMME